jgi:hypothetical protein
VIEEAALHEIDNLAVHACAQDVRTHHEDAGSTLRAGGRDARRDLGQAGVLVRRGDFIERQPVRGVQIADALGKRFHLQPGAVEDLDIYWPFANSAASSSSRHRKLGMMKSAPTPASRPRFHSSTVRHSGSAVATPTATPPTSLIFSIST